ncbi:mechanosensitive ion channel family protein [Pajaroellobacter abortibovis]|uniref:Mechanosensitive ion channel protein MscS n=1 Tax=Pajaroellobacter abortibovis TaxID=1882918 RepID=A0A1L6MYJ6_9BACT|nr:mechanosensitive ion channel family protein [Pajaroellobacter abortibovis]APS00485.1 hypothetical protein BCY86_07200 [Pajaroellobacter abortibovis]
MIKLKQSLRLLGLLSVLFLGLMCSPKNTLTPSLTNNTNNAIALSESRAAGEEEEKVAPDSPRASIAAFFSLTRRYQFIEAARYLDLPRSLPANKKIQLTQRLDAVLRRHLWIDLETVSPLSSGDPHDQLPPGYDELGKIPSSERYLDPIRLIKKWDPEGQSRWVFTRSTVEHIDEWYDSLSDRWIREHLPLPLLRIGPYDILWWQWISFPLIVLASWIVSSLLDHLTRSFISHLILKRTFLKQTNLFPMLAGPLRLAWGTALCSLSVPWLALHKAADHWTRGFLQAIFLFTLFWALIRIVDLFLSLATQSPWAKLNPPATSLLPLFGRFIKVALFILAIGESVSTLGYPVVSILAGLGIGGITIALAAKNTVENLFGTLALGIDQPFRIGDVITTETITGTVEVLGLRSTRIRTFDRTIVSFPNSKIADMRIENLTARDRFRLANMLTLVHTTTPKQLEQIVQNVRTLFQNHPHLADDKPFVFLKEINKYGIDIEVAAWFQVANYATFQHVRHDVLLQILSIIGETGSQLTAPLIQTSLPL